MLCESIGQGQGAGSRKVAENKEDSASPGSEQEQPLAILQSQAQTLGPEQTSEYDQKSCQGCMVSSANPDTPSPSRGGHNACTSFSRLMFLSRVSLPGAGKETASEKWSTASCPRCCGSAREPCHGLVDTAGLARDYSVTFKNQWRQFQMTHHNLSGLLGMNFMKTQRLLLDGQVLRMNQQATDHPPGKQQRKEEWAARGSLSRNPGPKELQLSKMTRTPAPLMNRGQSQAPAVGRGPHRALGAAGIQPGLCTAVSNASAPATLGESRHDLLTRLSSSRFPPHRPPPSQAHQTAKRPSVAALEPAGRTSSVADAATCPLLVPAKHPPPSLRTRSTELVLHKLAWVRPVEGIGEAGVPATSRGEEGGVQQYPYDYYCYSAVLLSVVNSLFALFALGSSAGRSFQQLP